MSDITWKTAGLIFKETRTAAEFLSPVEMFAKFLTPHELGPISLTCDIGGDPAFEMDIDPDFEKDLCDWLVARRDRREEIEPSREIVQVWFDEAAAMSDAVEDFLGATEYDISTCNVSDTSES